ncbi:hypothetical protein JZ751_014524 [Albula glossodonta]|uniref:mRNA-decapping enzyme C-terminal domain-containing protein n=1 Tax=Albula glossodonta TaxID=121402 RepID=A0A8T2MXW5_9TELE|nr:hypothetical protein JZ751_014524 [Albula glossodonta]
MKPVRGEDRSVVRSDTHYGIFNTNALIHLIKNDSNFLNAIHEAYLQSLSKDLNNVKL